MEITPTLPRYQTRNPRWHPKFNSYNCNMFFAKIQQIQSLTRPTTHAAFSTFSTFSLLTVYSTRVLQHQKQTKYSMLQIKNFLWCVVKKKFRYSFVLPKKYSVREINNFLKCYKSDWLTFSQPDCNKIFSYSFALWQKKYYYIWKQDSIQHWYKLEINFSKKKKGEKMSGKNFLNQ